MTTQQKHEVIDRALSDTDLNPDKGILTGIKDAIHFLGLNASDAELKSMHLLAFNTLLDRS